MSPATAHLRVRARRLALLLGGAAAIALLVGKPAHAITINDQTAQQFPPLGFGGPPFPAVAPPGTLPNYWDMNNVYSNVGEVNFNFNNNGGCTGTLINSRTVLTAAHCFLPLNDQYAGGATSVNFSANTAANPNLQTVSTTIVNQGFRPFATNSNANDIALIALAVPITNITPATLSPANPGINTVLAMVGYGNIGTGSVPAPVFPQPSNADGKRRVAYTQLGGYFPERTLKVHCSMLPGRSTPYDKCDKWRPARLHD